MGWFNYYGLIAVAIILIPNIISAAVDKSAFENRYNKKTILALEQIGRYGCIAFMIFNIPYTYFDFWFDLCGRCIPVGKRSISRAIFIGVDHLSKGARQSKNTLALHNAHCDFCVQQYYGAVNSAFDLFDNFRDWTYYDQL